jgi:hypothetical protein
MQLLNVHPHLAAARMRTRSIALAQGPMLEQSRRACVALRQGGPCRINRGRRSGGPSSGPVPRVWRMR